MSTRPGSSLLPLITMMVLSHLCYISTRIALSLYALQLGGSAFTAGMMMSLMAVFPMFLSVHTGRWTDRVGPAVPTLVSLSIVIAGALIPWLVRSVNGLYAASLIIGTGFMIGHIAINNAVGHASTPQNRTQNFGLMSLGFSTSSVLGPIVTGLAIDHLGHALTFAFLAAFPAVALAFWPRVKRNAGHARGGVKPPADAKVMDLARSAPLRAVFIVSALMSMGWDLFNFMMPIQGSRLGLSASTIGLIMGFFGAATFAVRAAMPWIARNFSEWQALTTALAVTGAVFFLFPLTSMIPVLLALAFVLGLGLGCGQPMVMSLIHLASPPGRAGEAVGVRTMLMNTSHTFLPLGFGALGSALGLVPVFWVIAVCMAAGAVFTGRRRGSVL